MPKFKTITDGQEQQHLSQSAAYDAVRDNAEMDPTGLTVVQEWEPRYEIWALVERAEHTAYQSTGK